MEKRASQCERMLRLLRESGDWVSLPTILNLRIANYRARISEARKAGYVIECRDEWTDGARHTFYKLVRVALREGRRLHPDNLGLFCTRCRRGEYEVRGTRKDIENLIYPMFGEAVTR